jgi:hypothetical protein
MKKIQILFGTLVVALTAALPLKAQNQLTNGLVAYYPFNGDANDAIGNGNNGTVVGPTLTFDRFDQANAAYLFMGWPLGTNYIEVPLFSTIALSDAATFSAWVQNTSSGGEYVLKKGQFLVDADYELAGDETSVRSEITLSGGELVQCTITNAALPIGVWTHIAGVFDGKNLSTYVNGQFKGSVSAVGTLQNNGFPLYIGADYGSHGGYFNGRIDDVRIYNRALSDAEVQRLFDLESGRPHTSIARAIRLDHEFVRAGTNYQLQVSHDLNSWTNLGSPFTATSSTNSQYLDVGDWNAFYRLIVP